MKQKILRVHHIALKALQIGRNSAIITYRIRVGDSFTNGLYKGRMEHYMLNMNNKKTKKTISAIIIVILLLAMVLPMISYML